jgi:hypothetical protein
MWLPGGSWNLGGFERALDEMIVRLSGTDSDACLGPVVRRNLTSPARVRVPRSSCAGKVPLVTHFFRYMWSVT